MNERTNNEYDLSDCHRNCCRGTIQKLSSSMALSVSEEITQRTGESSDVFRHLLKPDSQLHSRMSAGKPF